jgi:DNA-binding XRE family transcriptional regulator
MMNNTAAAQRPLFMPIVFISYSHDSDAHRQRVLELSERLRAEGVECEIDQYEVSPPEGWPKWMERIIRKADFVLVVCTETYRQRFDAEAPAGVGRGVKWESTLLTQHLYDADALNPKFIPIVFDDKDAAFVPVPLNGAARYKLDDAYEDLYRHLTDQPRVRRAPVGKIKNLLAAPPATAAVPLPPRGSMPPMPPNAEIAVEVVIDRPYDEYSSEEQENLMERVRTLLPHGDVSIKTKRRGSVRITLRLSPKDAELLRKAINDGKLSSHSVVGANFNKVKRLREEVAMTKRELSSLAQISVATLSNVERGGSYSPITARKILRALNDIRRSRGSSPLAMNEVFVSIDAG